MSGHAAHAKWTAEVLALLGKIPDTAIARRFQLNRVVVMRKRMRLGIPSANVADRKSSAWTDAELQVLRSYDDLQAARMTGKTLREIAAKRKELRRTRSR